MLLNVGTHYTREYIVKIQIKMYSDNIRQFEANWSQEVKRHIAAFAAGLIPIDLPKLFHTELFVEALTIAEVSFTFISNECKICFTFLEFDDVSSKTPTLSGSKS